MTGIIRAIRRLISPRAVLEESASCVEQKNSDHIVTPSNSAAPASNITVEPTTVAPVMEVRRGGSVPQVRPARTKTPRVLQHKKQRPSAAGWQAAQERVQRDAEHRRKAFDDFTHTESDRRSIRTKEMSEQHQKDSAKYAFRCARVGDFFDIKIKRILRPDDEKPSAERQLIRACDVRSIKLIKGLPPRNTGVRMLVCESPDRKPWEQESCRSIFPRRTIIISDDRGAFGPNSFFSLLPDSVEFCQPAAQDIALRQDQWPVPAVDDRIVFMGAGVVVFSPFGRGESVLRAISAAIESSEQRDATE